jgi:tRNA threonylcarbamoyladenosine biosynthesis protein TsaB
VGKRCVSHAVPFPPQADCFAIAILTICEIIKNSMKILAVDTATHSCSVAIVDYKYLLAELTVCSGQTHSKRLMKTIRTVMDMSGVKLSALDGFAVSSGPGSFTGLRIGISTVKGLAAATGKRLVGISNLDSLAIQSALPALLICPLLDARKGEVYYSRYRLKNGILKKVVKEQVASPSEAIGDIDEACLFAGDGALLHKKAIFGRLGPFARFVPHSQNIIRASTLADLSLDRFIKGDSDNLDSFAPHYIRRSDAELNRIRAQNLRGLGRD